MTTYPPPAGADPTSLSPATKVFNVLKTLVAEYTNTKTAPDIGAVFVFYRKAT